MQSPSIPSDISLFLAIAAAIISGYLQTDGLPSWKNAIIAGLAFVAEVVLTIWLVSGFSGSLKDVTLEFIALAVLLSGSELKSLLDYVRGAGSPLAPKPAPTAVVPAYRRASAVGTNAFVPPDSNTNSAK